ncbi:anthranilate synthase component I [Dehalococcoidia bacterium]|nr:anthranilate synthase component I [Dehalococcoidia bacterium]
MYTPTIEQVKSLSRKDGNLVPIYREINADLETPVSAYLKIARPPYSFLLESIEGGERLARYSFIGTEPSCLIQTGGNNPSLFGQDRTKKAVDPLTQIQRVLANFRPVPTPGLPRFHGGMVGYLGYESVRHFEPRVPIAKDDPLRLPESVFMLTDTLLVFDHLRHKIRVVSHANLDDGVDVAYAQAIGRIEVLVQRLVKPLKIPFPAARASDSKQNKGVPSPPSSNLTKQQYEDMVKQVKKYIEAGDCIQAVLSQRFSIPTHAAPFDLYRSLRAVNPSPYMYFLHLDDFHIIGASPETLVRIEDGLIDYHPIAGTRPRSDNPLRDAAFEDELRADEKERAEHIMLVDLGRNDVGRVSQPDSVKVTQLMDVERYSHVMHLVSHIQGHLRPELTIYDALRSCFPAGTVSGAPKIRAMEIISDLERDQRGPYAGAIGYFSFSGNMDTAIGIRTIVLKDSVAHVQTGAGIVFDSVPETEYQETQHKAEALLRAIHAAEEPGIL